MKKKIGALLLAGCLILSALTGCNGGKTESIDDMSQEVTLKWILPSSSIPADKDLVLEEVNKYLKEKINATLEIEFIQTGDYNTKTNMMLASQQADWDLMFTANWQNPYETQAEKGGYYPITELLKSETPELYEYYPEAYWDALTMNDGEIYAVPNDQIVANQKGLTFKKELVEKYNLEEDIRAAKSLEDLTPIFETIAENEPEVQALAYAIMDQYRPHNADIAAGFFINNKGEVSDGLDEYLLNDYKTLRDWYVKNILPQDINFNQETFMKLGRMFCRYERYLPGVEAKHRISYDWDAMTVATTEPVMIRAAVQSALTAINRNSKNPARALKLIELMMTDQYLFNLMAYGIEGTHYTKNGNKITPTENSYYVPEYNIGNQFLAYLMPGYEEGVWEETRKVNMETEPHESMGFIFDRVPVETEVTNVQSVQEYIGALNKGRAEDVEDTFQKHIDKRNDAGAQTVKEEIERQYAEWKAAQ